LSEQGSSTPAAPANGALAAVLSLLAVGAGHVYVGRVARGVRWYGVLAATAIGFGLLVRPLYLALGLSGIWIGVLAGVGVWVAAAVDAAKLAPSRPHRAKAAIVVAGFVAFWLGRVPIALALRALFVEAFKVPSGGVLPTLAVGDHLFVDKLLPRLRAPRRGDLIVFPFPEHPEQDFVKRVVALPNDTVRVEDSRLFVNGWQVPRCEVGRWSYTDVESSARHEGKVAMEYLGDSSFLVFDDDTQPPEASPSEWRVAPGEVFVIGDNRRNSHDSRMWFGGRGGGVPAGTVRGYALTVWMSIPGEGDIDWTRMGADLTGRKPLAPRGLEEGVARCLAARPSGALGPPG
jgi:signal peptidase I